MKTTPTFLTVGVLARRLGVPVHKIEHILRTRGYRPLGKAGAAFVYDEAVAHLIASDLDAIAARRTGGGR